MNRTTIEMNGQTIDLKFGLCANRIFFEKSVTHKFFDGDALNEVGIANLLYAGYLNDRIVKQTEPSLAFEDFNNLVDGSIITGDTKQLANAIKVWTESAFVQASIDSLKKAKASLKKVSAKAPAKKTRTAK